MMKANAKGQLIEANLEKGLTVSKRLNLGDTYDQFESFLKGLLKGMTFQNDNGSCKNGLLDIVEEAFNLIEYREVYIPSNTMKFMIALNSLNEAGNVVYA
jgi:hypothetical protein